MKSATTMRLAIALMFNLLIIPNVTAGQQEKVKETAATDQKPVVGYRIEITVREIEEGKRLNSRSYMMLVEDGSYGRIRVGNRVPIGNGEKGVQYDDVGMNIDCRPHEREGAVALDVQLVSSSVVAQEQTPGATTGNPVFRQQRTNIPAVVTEGKPTIVTAMDDVATNRRYEVEVTATKLK